MITTIILSIINFFWYGLIDLVWIRELPFLTLDMFESAISFFTVSLLPIYQVIDIIVPMDIVIYCILAFLGVYLLVFGVKAVRFVINLIRLTASV